MNLTKQQKPALISAITDPRAGQAVIEVLEADASSFTQADVVAALGTTSNLSPLVVTAATISASAGVFAIPAEPTGAEVNTAIDEASAKVVTALGLKADNADVETLRTQTEARLDAIEAKVDAVIAALKDAGLMASA
jgi:1-aminocyclopropane-1-carboxylate deaminase/D-cysteine desulfhydrase-like pyridoxal-dependent ACC family enzyme